MHLMGQDKQQGVVFQLEVLQVDTALRVAIDQEKEEVKRLALCKAVCAGNFGGKLAECWSDNTYIRTGSLWFCLYIPSNNPVFCIM
jgi:hypothetical protein